MACKYKGQLGCVSTVGGGYNCTASGSMGTSIFGGDCNEWALWPSFQVGQASYQIQVTVNITSQTCLFGCKCRLGMGIVVGNASWNFEVVAGQTNTFGPYDITSAVNSYVQANPGSFVPVEIYVNPSSGYCTNANLNYTITVASYISGATQAPTPTTPPSQYAPSPIQIPTPSVTIPIPSGVPAAAITINVAAPSECCLSFTDILGNHASICGSGTTALNGIQGIQDIVNVAVTSTQAGVTCSVSPNPPYFVTPPATLNISVTATTPTTTPTSTPITQAPTPSTPSLTSFLTSKTGMIILGGIGAALLLGIGIAMATSSKETEKA